MFDVKSIRRATAAVLLGVATLAVAAPADDMRKAVEFDDANTVQKLLARGIDPNLVDAKGNPMLVVALREQLLSAFQA